MPRAADTGDILTYGSTSRLAALCRLHEGVPHASQELAKHLGGARLMFARLEGVSARGGTPVGSLRDVLGTIGFHATHAMMLVFAFVDALGDAAGAPHVRALLLRSTASGFRARMLASHLRAEQETRAALIAFLSNTAAFFSPELPDEERERLTIDLLTAWEIPDRVVRGIARVAAGRPAYELERFAARALDGDIDEAALTPPEVEGFAELDDVKTRVEFTVDLALLGERG